MTRTVLLLVLVGTFLFTMAAFAHHSMTTQYDVSKEVRIEGTLVQFQFRNPHSFVHVEVPDENGQIQRWSIEWAGTAVLTGQGVTRTTLRVGDNVIITGNPSRTPNDHRLKMNTLRRTSDGFGWGKRPGELVD